LARRRNRGYTVLEFALVLGILGASALSLAPRLVRAQRRARSVEAVENLARIYAGECTYREFSAERAGTQGFVSAPPTPALPPSTERYPANPSAWTRSPAWNALGFALDQPHHFQYAVDATTSGFTAHAVGLHGEDGRLLDLTRAAHIDAQGDLVGTELRGFDHDD
jgi:type II secretory pathway pseudopilin PulG